MSNLSTDSKQQMAEIVANAIDRLSFARSMGHTAYEGDRDYNLVLGYPESISFEEYMGRYQRQDVATRVVDLPAKDTWKKPPKISEDDNTETEFVKAWEALNDRLGVFNALTRADKISGIGRYGILLIGFRDEQEDLSEPVSVDAITGVEDILYLRPYAEDRAEIREWDTDTESPRFGFPDIYEINVMDGVDPIDVHWSRVLHLADNKLDSEIFGIPRLRNVFNRLDDLLKIVGGTAEATWLNMRPGIMVGPKEGYDWEDTTDAETQWLEEVRRYAHDPLRMLRLVGLEASPIGQPTVVDPSAPYEVILSLISASTGIPQRVLTGSASGELAAAQEDTRQWAQFIAERQKNYAEPEILRPFIDLLIKVGALPEPANGYDVGNLDPDGATSWPSLIELSELERATAVSSQSTAVKNFADPTSQQLPITVDEQRELLGYPPLTPEQMEGEEPFEDMSALSIALRNFREGKISSDDLAQFALSVMADIDPLSVGEGSELRRAQLGESYVWAGAAKKKGPGKGWWGPPKGTHTGKDAGDVDAYGDAPSFSVRPTHMKAYLGGRYTTDVHHITSPENVMSIARRGLVPRTEGASGQDWKAQHSDYATYFHADKAAADSNYSQMASGSRAMVRGKLPKDRAFAHRILPDEDAYPTPSDGMRALKEKSPIAIIAGLERKHISGFVLDKGALPDADIAELRSMGYDVVLE